MQDILIAVHLKRQTWDDTRPIGPWIAGIARYKIIDAPRRRGRRTDLPIEDFADILPAETEPETVERARRHPLAGRAAGRPAQGGAGDRDRGRLDCGHGADAEHERGRGPGGAASRTGSFGETPSRRHMKTDDLIRALAADREPAGPHPGYALALAGALGFVLSVLLFMWLVPLRPNLGEAMRSFAVHAEAGRDGHSGRGVRDRCAAAGQARRAARAHCWLRPLRCRRSWSPRSRSN